jgi:alpha-tubulin suppressor-like RCC1 family protein
VSAGGSHTCGVTDVGSLECFGSDGFGQSNKYQPKYPKKGNGKKFIQVSAGNTHTCGLTDVGSLECFGSDRQNGCNKFKPKYPPYGKQYKNVAAGNSYTCGMTNAGEIICFGADNYGQSNNGKEKVPTQQVYLGQGCYVGSNGIDCNWNKGLFVEAGLLRTEHNARVVRAGIVGNVVKSSILTKKGTTVAVGEEKMSVSNDALPYGRYGEWNKPTTTRTRP